MFLNKPDACFRGGCHYGMVLRRVAQVGSGKVFGSAAFVLLAAGSLCALFRGRAGAHPVGEIGHSTHGWRLARAVA